MQQDSNRGSTSHVPFLRRLVLVLVVWGFALLAFFSSPNLAPAGLLITVLGEDVFPVWFQTVVCLFYVVTTWALLVYSRPTGFFVLYVVLIMALVLNLVILSSICSASLFSTCLDMACSMKNPSWPSSTGRRPPTPSTPSCHTGSSPRLHHLVPGDDGLLIRGGPAEDRRQIAPYARGRGCKAAEKLRIS